MDIKEKVEEIVKKLESDKELQEKFKADPVATLEGLAGIDIPEDELKKIIALVKGKVEIDDIAGALKGLFNK